MKNHKLKNLSTLLLALVLALPVNAEEVNLYTDRQEVFLRPVLAAFKEDSGTQVNVLFVKKGLLERMKAEGAASPADVLLMVDAGRLQDFVDAGLTAANNDAALQKALPAGLRAPDNHWFAVTRRARVLYTSVLATDVNNYDGLSGGKYKICSRSGLHPYNIALFADIIGRKGENAARQWLQGVKDNLARPPRGNDRAQIRGVLNGECDIAVANSYYYFHMLKKADEQMRQRLSKEIKMLIPPHPHINITGMALAVNSPNRKAGKTLMRFLISPKAQRIYAGENFEFPARNDVQYPPQLAPYKDALTSKAQLKNIAKWRKVASELVEDVGFDRP